MRLNTHKRDVGHSATEITLEDGTYGRRAVLNTSWHATMAEYLKRNEVVELELNQAKGWWGDDLGFLLQLPHLKLFEIFDFNIKDISPIHLLSNLKTLGVTTYCSTAIDFSAFPALEHCGLEWRPKATSLFGCSTLKTLFVNRYKGKNVDSFASLTNLESLAILNAPVANLHGLGALKNLRSLRLGVLRRLTSLAGIERLSNLEKLNIDTCRFFKNIDEISALAQLKTLFLNNDGEIDSLKPLASLPRLEWVGFSESTNIKDGDLSPLFEKKLSSISFQNRRHYSHRREDFGAAYFGTAYSGVKHGLVPQKMWGRSLRRQKRLTRHV
jgi:hypothetical protein